MGLSNKLSCEAGSSSHHHNPHRCFQSEALRLYFPGLEPWAVWSFLLPSCCFSQFVCTQMWGHPVCQPPCGKSSPPGCPSPPLLPVWRNVSSLTAWSSDFLTVRFSGSSGGFLVFKLFVVLLLVVQGGTVYLSTPPSWLEVPLSFRIVLFSFVCYCKCRPTGFPHLRTPQSVTINFKLAIYYSQGFVANVTVSSEGGFKRGFQNVFTNTYISFKG